MATIKSSRYLKLSPIVWIGLIALLLLTGCKPTNTPEGVALAFWQALAANDLDAAHALTVESTPIAQDDNLPSLQNATLKTGEIVINAETAKVETLITTDQPEPLILQTFLVKAQGEWKVDYQHTQNNLRLAPLNDVFKSLENIGGTLNKQFEQGMQQFGEELKKQVDEFGRELQKNLPDPKAPTDGSI